jgi:hypothetical protein
MREDLRQERDKRGMRKLLLTLCLFIIGCQPTMPEVPKDLGPWRASLGSAGGASGGGGGLEVWSDGSVFSYTIDLAPGSRKSEYLGQLSEQDTKDLLLDLLRAKDVKHQKYENMTTSMSWTSMNSAFRHDWSWPMGDTSIPKALSSLETRLNRENMTLTPGDPPAFMGVQGRADVFVAIDGSFDLTLSGTGGEAVRGKGKGPLGLLSELKGQNIPLESDVGEIRVTNVENGWLTGEVKRGDKVDSFRLPAWFEVAP